MSEASVAVHADADLLAQAVAARLLVKLLDAQADRGEASVVLTGGRVAAAVYRAVATLPARDAVDWSRVDVWWGDERFLPAGDPDRNETQARAALLDVVPLDPARVHPMPASDGPAGNDPEAAAAAYAEELARAARPGHATLPHFDVLMLGVGEDGHVASVFPEHPVSYETRPVSAVRGSPAAADADHPHPGGDQHRRGDLAGGRRRRQGSRGGYGVGRRRAGAVACGRRAGRGPHPLAAGPGGGSRRARPAA